MDLKIRLVLDHLKETKKPFIKIRLLFSCNLAQSESMSLNWPVILRASTKTKIFVNQEKKIKVQKYASVLL
jgi:hypothetical protein